MKIDIEKLIELLWMGTDYDQIVISKKRIQNIADSLTEEREPVEKMETEYIEAALEVLAEFIKCLCSVPDDSNISIKAKQQLEALKARVG